MIEVTLYNENRRMLIHPEDIIAIEEPSNRSMEKGVNTRIILRMASSFKPYQSDATLVLDNTSLAVTNTYDSLKFLLKIGKA